MKIKHILFTVAILLCVSSLGNSQIIELNGIPALKDTVTDVHELIKDFEKATGDTLTDIHENMQIGIKAAQDTTTNVHKALKIFEQATGDTLTDVHKDLLVRILTSQDTTSNTHLDLLLRELANRDTTSGAHSNLLAKILSGTSANADSFWSVHSDLLARILAGTDSIKNTHLDLLARVLAGTDTSKGIHLDFLERILAVRDTISGAHSNLLNFEQSIKDSLTNVHTDIEQMRLWNVTRIKIATTTEDLAQIAGNYVLFTGTTADVILENLTLRNADVDCSDDATFTGLSIQTNDTTPIVFITQANGIKANLTGEAQLAWTGSAIIKSGTAIRLTIYGDAADATCAPDIMVTYRSTGAGTGTLEP